MRRLLLLLVTAAAACGDPPSTPAPAPGPAAAPAADPGAGVPAADAPFEAWFGDPNLYERVWDAAASGRTDDLAFLTLPPRCDRVRVAVRVLHDQLLGLRKDAPDRAKVFDALHALARAKGGATPASLGEIVETWRTWDETQVTQERDLAAKYAAALRLIQAPKLDGNALAAAIAGSGAAPPRSPAGASLTFLRGVVLLASAPPSSAVPPEVGDAWDHARKGFDDLGWPGGFGSLADHMAKRLLRDDPSSFRATNLVAHAQSAYDASGDEVRAAMTFLAVSEAAQRRGDLRAAEYAAEGARRRFQQSSARGPELVDVLVTHGTLCQMLGRQTDAARDLGRAYEEAKWSRLDAPTRASIAQKLVTSLVIVGRFDDAYAAAREAAKALDDEGAAGVDPATRAELDEIAAQAALDLGRAAEAHALLTSAAVRHAAMSKDPRDEWRRRADADRLLAARARVKEGDAAGAAKDVAAVLAQDGVDAAAHAHASSIYRDAGLLDDAERELARAEKEGGEEFAVALTEERARLAAARRDWDGARELFRNALKRVTPEDPAATAGWDAARVLLDWARMERDLGRVFEASELAGRAVVELRESGLAVELDRARELYVSLQRRRNMWIDAAKATEQRLAAGKIGDAARRENVLLDLLLIRIEQLLAGATNGEAAAREVAAQFEDGWRRDVANVAVGSAVGGFQGNREVQTFPDSVSERWRLLYDVALESPDLNSPDRLLGLARRCGDTESELRRWAAALAFKLELAERPVELRRHPVPDDVDAAKLALRDDEAVLLVEPFGGDTITVLLRKNGRRLGRRIDGDAGLAALWDATWVEPPKLADAARRVSDALFGGGGKGGDLEAPREFLTGVRRLWVSLPEPLGPLPFDLLPYGDGMLIDAFEVMTVNSLAELNTARARTDPPLLTELVSPYATLDLRHALVRVGMTDPAARTRLFELIGQAQNKGLDTSAALREAKLALRKETAADPKRVPAWAAFLLRGAR